jgi:hypothetical protein
MACASSHRIPRAFLVVSAFAAMCTSAFAEAPSVKSIFPAGVERGKTVEVTVAGTLKPWPPQVHVVGTGVRFEPAKAEGKFNVVVAADAPVGPRWIRFANDEGASAVRPFFVGALPEVNETEPNDELTQAKLISPDLTKQPIVVNGALAKGEKGADVDAFRVHLKKGETLVACADAYRTLGSPIDGVLQLVSAAGFVVTQSNDELNLDARIVFTAPQEADYYVRLFGFPAVGTTAIRFVGDPAGIYRLTLTTGPYVDVAYPPLARVGAPARFELTGWNLGAKTSFELPSLAAASPIARVLPIAEPGNPEYLTVDAPIFVERESFGDAKGTPSPLTITGPSFVAGRIDRPGDRDIYTLKVAKQQFFKFKVHSQSLAFPVDPVLRLEDPEGKPLGRFDDGKRGEFDVDAVYRAPADGEVRLLIEDAFGGGGPRHAYVLEVRTGEPDFTLALATTELTAEIGKPLEIPVTIERHPDHKTDIEIRLEGLPAEFGEVKAVSSPKGETAAKVVLKLTATKPHQGLVRVVGKSKVKTEVRAIAKAPVAAMPTPTPADAYVDEVLLVVGPAKKK